jgi:hypothetical protein
VNPPAANAAFPTNVPATNERATPRGQRTLHELVGGSYRKPAPVVHGSSRNGFPPPQTYTLPEREPLAGTFVGAGTGDSVCQVLVPMW